MSTKPPRRLVPPWKNFPNNTAPARYDSAPPTSSPRCAATRTSQPRVSSSTSRRNYEVRDLARLPQPAAVAPTLDRHLPGHSLLGHARRGPRLRLGMGVRAPPHRRRIPPFGLPHPRRDRRP